LLEELMMALRKLIAASLAAALPMAALAQAAATPAAAPAPLVTIYGTLNLNTQWTDAGDATAGSASDVSGRFAVSSDSTNIGFRGGLDVAHGLKVVYQCETAAGLDISAGSLCGRNSRVGLSGNFGTLFWGNWDTPFKAGTYGTKADDPFGNTDVFAYQGIMGSPGFGARSGAWAGSGVVHSFDLRAGNSIAYWSPKFGPVSFKVQYSANENRSAVGTVDPTLLSGVVNVDLGALSLVASTEYHEDAYGIRFSGANAGNTASKDLAWRLAAGYEIPLPVGALTVMGMVDQLMYTQDEAAGAADLEDYDRLAWLVGAKFRMANHEFRGRFSMALDGNCTIAGGADCGDLTDDSGATQLAVGYAYHLAKSTQVYAFYTQIMNDDDARYTFSIGGSGPVVGTGAVNSGPPAGADPLAIGAGIRYAF
jgi:predicted porin